MGVFLKDLTRILSLTRNFHIKHITVTFYNVHDLKFYIAYKIYICVIMCKTEQCKKEHIVVDNAFTGISTNKIVFLNIFVWSC